MRRARHRALTALFAARLARIDGLLAPFHGLRTDELTSLARYQRRLLTRARRSTLGDIEALHRTIPIEDKDGPDGYDPLPREYEGM